VFIVKIEIRPGERYMRDLTVADLHTYFVIASGQPVLVHNMAAPCRRGGMGPVLSGKRGIAMAEADLRAQGYTVIAKEVRIEANGAPGVRTYVDIVALNPKGNIEFFEVKNGAKAPFTKNQQIVYQRLPLRGGVLQSDRLDSYGYRACC
jgi:hypothetical protein